MALLAGLVAVPATPVSAQTPVVDYDVDDDGLIEVSSLAQLNAIRWDLDGDGMSDVYPPSKDGITGHDPDGAAKLAAAFPNAAANMGCPTDGCDGYELAADLDFDTNGNGSADSGDEYWNGGKGWNPLMGGEAIYGGEAYERFKDHSAGAYYGQRPHSRARMFTAVFEGNGRTIANLHIDDLSRFFVGLFGYVGPGGHVRNVGLTAPNSDSRVRGWYLVGALAGDVEGGRVSGAYSHVDVSAAYSYAGGLAGSNWRHGVIVESYATGDVSGPANVGGLVGMLNEAGATAVYATGSVSASQRNAGGLVGHRPGGYMRAAYATGDVTVTHGFYYSGSAWWLPNQNNAVAGGLAGLYVHSNSRDTRANYSTGAVTVPGGHAGSGGLIGLCRPHAGDEPKASYWDAEASGRSSGECATGLTTAQLQAPTGYAGIYSTWNLDIDGDGTGDDPWDFGTSSQYPVLKYCAAKPGIDTADGLPYCPLRPDRQRTAAATTKTTADGADGDGGYTVDAAVVAKVQDLASQTQHGTAHVNRWQRALAGLGALDPAAVSGGAMTAAQAQQMADAHSSPVWDEVVAELTALEASHPPQRSKLVVPTPEVSVSAGGDITEGEDAVFTVSASPAPAADLAVSVTATTAGDFGYGTLPTSVTIPASGSATVTIATTDDQADEPDGSVTLTVGAGSGYTVGAPSSETVAVADDDDPPAQEQTHTADPAVVAKVQDLASQTQHGTAHVNRWRRALAGLGALDPAAVSGGAMTAAQAQQMADAHSSPVWDEVVAELTALEAAPQQTPPPPPPPPPPTPVVSIAAGGGITEGGSATFTLSASPAPAADLDVTVTVSVVGDYGAATGQRTVTIPTSGTATLAVATQDDSAEEPDGTVTVTLVDGSAYDLGSSKTATVAVADDDDPPPPPPVEQDEPDQPDQQDDAALAACEGKEPTLSISSPQASRSDPTVDFQVSLDCIPSGRPMILVTPVRDGDIGENMFISLSADQTSATVTVTIGTENQLGLALAWESGLANRQAQGNVDYTD